MFLSAGKLVSCHLIHFIKHKRTVFYLALFVIFPHFPLSGGHLQYVLINKTSDWVLETASASVCFRETLLLWCLYSELNKSVKTGHSSTCICTLKRLSFLCTLLFIFLVYNSGKGPCRCSLGFYVRSYLTDTRKCQPNPKVKNNLIIPFRERSPVTDAGDLTGHMHPSLLSLREKKTGQSHIFNLFIKSFR